MVWQMLLQLEAPAFKEIPAPMKRVMFSEPTRLMSGEKLFSIWESNSYY